MAVSYVHSTEAQAAAKTLTLTAPTGIQDNDILFVGIYARLAFGTVGYPTAPDDSWTRIADHIVSSNQKFSIFWKRAASESGDYTFTISTGSGMGGVIGCYRGCLLTGSPVDVFSNTGYTTNNTIIRAASITPTVGGGMFIFCSRNGCTSTIYLTSNPLSMSSRHILTYVAQQVGISLADLTYADTSASGDKDATLTLDLTTQKHAFLVALKPEPEAPTTLIKSINDLIIAATKTINDLTEWKNVNGLE